MTNSNIDLELFLCTEILSLNSLHFGYWEGNEEHTLENLKKAQIRFNNKLIEMIPEGIETILDVGCGIGDVAVSLAERGYTVTALSPDGNHKKYFDGYNDSKISFCQSKFEDFESEMKYDLILMSESQNYFATDIGFRQTLRCLKKNGYLLVTGIFRKQNSNQFKRTINITGDYQERASNNGLTLIDSIDISENIFPNLYFADHVFEEYIRPSFGMIEQYISTISPVKLFLIKLFFFKQFRQFKEAADYYRERFSSCQFKQYAEYMTFLFKL